MAQEDLLDKNFDIKLLTKLSDRKRYKINEGEGRTQRSHFYTIGQRKGLSVGGNSQPLFVIDTDIKTNTVYRVKVKIIKVCSEKHSRSKGSKNGFVQI